MNLLDSIHDPGEGPGPWFVAAFDSTCATCGWNISEGDEIRATGTGGYECWECGCD